MAILTQRLVRSLMRVLFRVAVFIVLLSCCFIAYSKPQRNKNIQRNDSAVQTRDTKRSAAIENLISNARMLPAEFAIDALLRISRSSLVDKRWKLEILEEAFLLTSSLQNNLRQRAIVLPGSVVDTRAGYRTYAFDHKLDQLSLRGRIIDLMLPLNNERAFKMFSEIPARLPFKSLSCSDLMAYDVSDFYRMIANIARVGFNDKSVEQGDRVHFLLPYVENMSSPAQVAPVADLLTSANLRSKELLILSQTFAVSLKKISGDDRSFTAALTHGRAADNVLTLIQSYRKGDVPYVELLGALRVFLSKHFNGLRCVDTFEQNGTELPTHVREINYFFPDKPFTLDDVKPSKLEDGATSVPYFESMTAGKLLTDFKFLRGYDDDEPSLKELKKSAAWQERWLEYLRQLEDWDGSDEKSELDYFHQKCVLYLALAELTPNGQARHQVVLSFLKLLNQESLMRESRIDWFLHANKLLQMVSKEKGDELSKLLDLLLFSKNPVLQVYAEMIRANLL